MDTDLHKSFDFPVDIDIPDAEEEAALEAIRAAINGNSDAAPGSSAALDSAIDPSLTALTAVSRADTEQRQVELALHALDTLSSQNVALLDSLDFAGVLGGMVSNLRTLVTGLKRQGELVRSLAAQMSGDGTGLAAIDTALAGTHVSRAAYDELKAKYDDLLASSAGRAEGGSKKRKLRGNKAATSVEPGGEEGDDKSARKRRSIKLEMANRRVGLEYPISGFRVPGASVLPDPSTPAPPINLSVNWVQEFRPDWSKPADASDIRGYIDAVTGDVWAAWIGGIGEGEEAIDIAKVQEAVETYWSRLQKRWLEQEAKIRGEVHRDELTRRKQNQYRRQQSLLARRTAAFDASPLNACRHRALYRTLLTIDFASPTNERPDPSRQYSEDQWHAYRQEQLGAKAASGHEVIDFFWLSSEARAVLALLDVFSFARSSTQKRKGRPKAPAPLFHLPNTLWDRSTARWPTLRPKDANGLPLPGKPGIVLFRFHIHPSILEQFPDWAAGLYDHPPVDPADASLPSLAVIMAMPEYSALSARVKRETQAAEVSELPGVQILQILARGGPEVLGTADNEGAGDEEEEDLIIDAPVSLVFPPAVPGAGESGPSAGLGHVEYIEDDDPSADLDRAGSGTYVALSQAQAEAEARLALQAANAAEAGSSTALERHSTPLAPVGMAKGDANPGSAMTGPGLGSSLRARKQGKKSMITTPHGAAVPVPSVKRAKGGPAGGLGVGVGVGVGVGMGLGSGGNGTEDSSEAISREIEADFAFLA